jgi:hypothetical protein
MNCRPAQTLARVVITLVITVSGMSVAKRAGGLPKVHSVSHERVAADVDRFCA